LLGKVPEQRALGQAHALGDGGGGDVAGVLFGGQFDHGFHRSGATLVGGQGAGTQAHRSSGQ